MFESSHRSDISRCQRFSQSESSAKFNIGINTLFRSCPSSSEKVILRIWLYVGIDILFFLSQTNLSLYRIWCDRLRSSKVLNRKRYLWFRAPFSKRAFWYPPSVRFRVISRHFKYVLNCLKQSYFFKSLRLLLYFFKSLCLFWQLRTTLKWSLEIDSGLDPAVKL